MNFKVPWTTKNFKGGNFKTFAWQLAPNTFDATLVPGGFNGGIDGAKAFKVRRTPNRSHTSTEICSPKSKNLPALKIKMQHVSFANSQPKARMIKLIFLFVKNNDLGLSSQKQYELSLLHPDVVVERLQKMAKVK